jgi:hypothetical protein
VSLSGVSSFKSAALAEFVVEWTDPYAKENLDEESQGHGEQMTVWFLWIWGMSTND